MTPSAGNPRSLHDLPELVRRLRDDAQTLRRLYDELQEALAAP